MGSRVEWVIRCGRTGVDNDERAGDVEGPFTLFEKDVKPPRKETIGAKTLHGNAFEIGYQLLLPRARTANVVVTLLLLSTRCLSVIRKSGTPTFR